MPNSNVRNQSYGVPFGRYPFKGAAGSHEPLVGREKQRSRLTRLLLDARQRTSVLITGRRGVGKTTFVDECIADYENLIFRRFLRSRQGKTVLDHITLVVAIALMGVLGLVAADLLELFSPLVGQSPLLIIFVLIASAICLAPSFVAWRVLLSAVYVQRSSGYWCTPITWIIFAACVWLALPISDAPSIGLSRALLAFSLLGLLGETVSIGYRGLAGWSLTRIRPFRVWFQIVPWLIRLAIRIGPPLAVMVWGAGWLESEFGFSVVQVTKNYQPQIPVEFFANLVFAAVCFIGLVCAKILRSIRDWRIQSIMQAVPVQRIFFRKCWILFLFLALLTAVFGLLAYGRDLGLPLNLFLDFRDNTKAEGMVLQPMHMGLAVIGVGAWIIAWMLVLPWLWRIFYLCAPRPQDASGDLTERMSASTIWHPLFEYALLKGLFLVLISAHLIYGVLGLYYDQEHLRAEERETCESARIADAIDLAKGFAQEVYPGQRGSGDGEASVGTLIRSPDMPGPAIEPPACSQAAIEVSVGLVAKLSQKTVEETQRTTKETWDKLFAKTFPQASPNNLEGPEGSQLAAVDPAAIADISRKIDVFKTMRRPIRLDNPDHLLGVFPQGYEPPRLYSVTLFAAPWEEAIWLTLFVACFLVIFFLDYEWVNRTVVSVQDARGNNPSLRRLWRPGFEFDPIAGWLAQAKRLAANKSSEAPLSLDDILESIPRDEFEKMEDRRRVIARRLETTTFAYYLYRSLMRPLIVRVNLGFDELNHRGVTLAMLTGLRARYVEKFLNMRSEVAVFAWLIKLFIAALLTTYISKSLVDFPDIDAAAGPWIAKNLALRNGEKEPVRPFLSVPYCAILRAHAAGQGAGVTALLEQRPGFPWMRVDGLKQLLNDRPVTNTAEDASWAGNRSRRATLPLAICHAFPVLSDSMLPLGFAPLLSVDLDTRHLSHKVAFSILHKNNGLPQFAQTAEGNSVPSWALRNKEDLTFRVYHLVLFLLTIALINRLLTLFPLLPYRKTARDVQNLMTMLLARRMEGSRGGLGSGNGWLSRLLFRERYAELSQESLDPRMVEYRLFGILEQMQSDRSQLPLVPSVSFGIPMPEITFVFDELDKITGVIGTDKPEGQQIADIQALDAERQRTYALRGLLSDMKRLISAAPARFIFVGNRLLHDEWIADNTRRTPLLTSIFDEEIYLPSLLMDTGSVIDGSQADLARIMTDRFWEYLHRVFDEAEHNYSRTLRMRTSPFFAQSDNAPQESRYSDRHYDVQTIRGGRRRYQLTGGRRTVYKDVFLPIHRTADGSSLDSTSLPGKGTGVPGPGDNSWRRHFATSFINFLTLRSLGNPKKMQQLLTSYVEPAARVAPPPADIYVPPRTNLYTDHTDRIMGLLRLRESVFNVDDVLHFGVNDVYRLQLVSAILRHLLDSVARTSVPADDKVIVSLLYMFEFLFKFHGRGFSWSSLERIEELAHIHRSPELRDLMRDMVNASSERFLHKVLNGMYAFRFRSDFAVEIRRLSRLFEDEQAAFNFTLDESQTLKATYIALLQQSTAANIDVVTALGELYEFDQDYDTARHHYRHAVRLNDETLFYHTGREVESEDPFADEAEQQMKQARKAGKPMTPEPLFYAPGQASSMVATLAAIMRPDQQLRQNVLVYAPWSVRRLRLMLRIGMTYEQVNDLEMAQLHYRDARKMSFALIDIFSKGIAGDTTVGKDISLLKHMNVLYQGIFCEAWVSQKMPSSVDGSISIVEKSLLRLRTMLSALSDARTGTEMAETAAGRLQARRGSTGDKGIESQPMDGGVSHVHQTLIGAEMHNKAGDLYFFKGRSFLDFDELATWVNEAKDSAPPGNRAEGFILRAHYHYVVGLHEVRRFITFRRGISSWKLGLQMEPGDKAWETIHAGQWPDFVFLSAASNISDMADAILSRSATLIGMLDLAETDVLREPSTGRRPLDEIAFTDKVAQLMKKNDGPRTNIKMMRDTLVRFLEDEELPVRQVQTDELPAAEVMRDLVSHFMGTWIGIQKEVTTYPSLVRFKGPSCAFERLFAGLHFMAASASFAERAGYPEDAAAEHLMTVEFVAVQLLRLRVLDSARVAIDAELDTHEEMPQDQRDKKDVRKLQKQLQTLLNAHLGPKGSSPCGDGRTTLQIELVLYLLDMAHHCLNEYYGLKKSVAKRKNEDYRVGSVVYESAVTAACEVILHAAGLLSPLLDETEVSEGVRAGVRAHPDRKRLAERARDGLGNIRRLLKDWMKDSFDAALVSGQEGFIRRHVPPEDEKAPEDRVALDYFIETRAILNYVLIRHPFPVLNQIHGLRVLIDDALLSFPGRSEDNQHKGDPEDPRYWDLELSRTIWFYLREVNQLAEQLQAPMHVTPMEVGRSAALYWLRESNFGRSVRTYENEAGKVGKPSINWHDEAYRIATNALRQSRETYTMGRTFRDSISRLYYLFDDFNDRRLHTKHALQMSDMETCAIFEELLRAYKPQVQQPDKHDQIWK